MDEVKVPSIRNKVSLVWAVEYDYVQVGARL